MGKSLKGLVECFNVAKETNQKYVGVLIQMEGFPKPEIIINENENIETKSAYYQKAYNDNLTLKTFNGIKIIGYAFGDNVNDIIAYLTNRI